MRRLTLIRCGVASVLLGGVVAAGMLAAGCGGDDNKGGPAPGDDSGSDATQPPPGDDGSTPPPGDGGHVGPDAADAGDAGLPAPVHGKVILVHASAYAPPLRFCYGSINGDAGTVTIVPGVYPAPNTALGVPPGTGGPAADTPVDLVHRTLEIYAIASASLTSQVPTDAGTELTCDKLIGSKALAVDAGGLPLALGLNYWDLGTLPAETLADGTTTLLAVTGCAPNNTTSAAVSCPPGYDAGSGDLGFATFKLDTSTPLEAGALGAQFAYLSYPFSFEATGFAMGPTAAVAGFLTTTLVTPDAGANEAGASDAGDGGSVEAGPVQPVPVTTTIPIAAGVPYGHLAPAALAPVPGLSFDNLTSFFASAVAADGGTTPFKLAVPLPSIQAVSSPTLTSPEFGNGTGYVFILVGDPQLPTYLGADGGASTADAGSFNPFSAHILGFPTNPPFGN